MELLNEDAKRDVDQAVEDAFAATVRTKGADANKASAECARAVYAATRALGLERHALAECDDAEGV